MVQSKTAIIPLLLLLSPTFVVAKSKLPELTTKQDIRNIRYVSADGKITYYQRGNGSLQFSTNYSVKEVIKGEPKTSYQVHVGKNKKFAFISANESFHMYYSNRSAPDIYIVTYGESKAEFLAKGIPIALHLGDEWLSFYNSFSKKLTIQNHVNKSLKHEIRLADKPNPYFKPSAIMPDEDTLVYTDLNKEGIPGVLKFKINAQKISVVKKLDSSLKRLELCMNKEKVFILETSLDPITRGTKIISLSKSELENSKENQIYSSEENDIGGMICQHNDENIYFVKTIRSESGKLTYEAAEVNITSKKVNILSDIDFATSLILMDNRILLPYQDKFFVLKGESNLLNFDKLKQKEEP